MRFLVTCRVPVEKGNELSKAGTLGSTIQANLDEIKPEAVYFAIIDGARGCYFVVDLDDASQMPAVAEPLFLSTGASVTFQPLMTAEGLMKAMPVIEQAAQRFG